MSPEGFVTSSEQIERLDKWIKDKKGVAQRKKAKVERRKIKIEGIKDADGVLDYLNASLEPDVVKDTFLIEGKQFAIYGYNDEIHADSKTIYCSDKHAQELEQTGIAVFPEPQQKK